MNKKIVCLISLLIGSATLVSCNRSAYKAVFKYNTFDEIKMSLNNATVKDNAGNGGVYVFDKDENENAIKPSRYAYEFNTLTTRSEYKNMTKENLMVNVNNFGVVSIIETEEKENKFMYLLTSNKMFTKDILDYNFKTSDILIEKSSTKLYRQYKVNFDIKVNILNENKEKVIYHVATLSTNVSSDQAKIVSEKIVHNLEYVQIGK